MALNESSQSNLRTDGVGTAAGLGDLSLTGAWAFTMEVSGIFAFELHGSRIEPLISECPKSSPAVVGMLLKGL